MINLEDLVEENEAVAKYHVTSDGLATRECIINKDSDDISGALEDTLHRILDNGGNEDDVWRILGAKIPEEDEWDDLNEFNEYINIDLGYVICGLIDSFLK